MQHLYECPSFYLNTSKTVPCQGRTNLKKYLVDGCPFVFIWKTIPCQGTANKQKHVLWYPSIYKKVKQLPCYVASHFLMLMMFYPLCFENALKMLKPIRLLLSFSYRLDWGSVVNNWPIWFIYFSGLVNCSQRVSCFFCSRFSIPKFKILNSSAAAAEFWILDFASYHYLFTTKIHKS